MSSKKMTIYFYILLSKIYFAPPAELLNIVSTESDEFDETDELNEHNKTTQSVSDKTKCLAIYKKKNMTHDLIGEIYNERNIADTEYYIRWLMSETVYLTFDEQIYISILLQRLCELNNNSLYDWLRTRYDVILVDIIIIIYKLYSEDRACQNCCYSKLFDLKIHEINITEIVLIKLLYLNISNENWMHYFSDFHKLYLNT